MDINYVILAHKNPKQLERLIGRLQTHNTFFYVHIDKRVEVNPFKDLLGSNRNVYFVDKREAGTWGDVGIVKATLSALKQIISDKRNGYCVLLSGQDYPLRSKETIRRVLEKSGGAVFADTWSLPCDKWYNGGLYRLRFYKYNVPDGERNYMLVPSFFSRDFYRHPRANAKKVWKLIQHGKLPVQLLKPRRIPSVVKPFGGSQWWAVTTHMAGLLTSFLENHKAYLRFHKFTLLADEILFQSLIMHFSALEDIPVKPSLTYLRWETSDSAHPVTFGAAHAAELKKVCAHQPEKLFARKFEPDDPVLTVIDRFE